MRLILASSSPRRSEILARLGLPFEIVSPGLEELFRPDRSPREEAVYWALEKARAIHRRNSGAIVLGCDTVIDLDGQTIGKPSDSGDAVGILSQMSGREHWVVTAAAAVFPDGKERIAVEKTKVRMPPASRETLVQYVATGEPLDKAGAYSLQGGGRKLIASIEGDFLSAVGLPLRAVALLLEEGGLRPAADVERIYREKALMNWKSYL